MIKEPINTPTQPQTQNKPQKLNRAFLNKRKKLLSNKIEEQPQLKEFVLLLMKNNGHADFIEGVQAGEFYMKNASGTQEKSILLTPNKLTTFNYNGQYFKGWISHEDNMSPYPQDPLHNGEMYRKTTQKIAMNYKDANEAKVLDAKRKFWIFIIIGGVIALYVLFIIAKGAGWIAGGEQAIINATTNITNITANTGVTIQ